MDPVLIPVVFIFLQDKILIRHIFCQTERTVRKARLRICIPPAVRGIRISLTGRRIHRKPQKVQEIYAGLREAEGQRVVVRSLHPQRVHLCLSVVDRLCVLDGEQIICISAAGRRIQGACDRVQEVCGGHRRPVRPEGVFPQVKSPHRGILVHFVRLRCPVLDLPVLVKSEEFVQGAHRVGEIGKCNGPGRIHGPCLAVDRHRNRLFSTLCPCASSAPCTGTSCQGCRAEHHP